MALFRAQRAVCFQEVDAAGIVFFATFFSYFHDAYVQWIQGAGADLAQALREKSWAAPLVHAEADYAKPLRFGHEVHVEIVEAVQGTTSLTVSYAVRSPGGETTFATGKTVHVFLDGKTFRPMAPPSWLEGATRAKAGEAKD